MRSKRLLAFGFLLLSAASLVGADIKQTVEQESSKHQPLRIEYLASRADVIAASISSVNFINVTPSSW